MASLAASMSDAVCCLVHHMMQLTGSGEHLSSEFWSTPDNRSPASHAVLPLMLQPAFSVERQSRRQIYGEAERLNQRQLQHESTHRRVCVFQVNPE